jgi:hypothetical protein
MAPEREETDGESASLAANPLLLPSLGCVYRLASSVLIGAAAELVPLAFASTGE